MIWPSPRRKIRAWIAGYLTAYNAYGYDGPDVAEGTDFEALYARIDKYCRENPVENLVMAVHELILELLSRQGMK